MPPAAPAPVPFPLASAVLPRGEGRYGVEVGEAWLQGRGAFGGLVAAWLVRACAAEAGAGALRAFSCQFCAPARPGLAEVKVRRVRRGTSVDFFAGELARGERVIASATASFGAARAGEDPGVSGATPRAPEVPPPEALAPFVPPPEYPTYLQHLELRFAAGGVGAGGDLMAAWCRLREPAPFDAALAVALIDALPPACFTRLARPRPAGTVSLSAHLVGALPAAGEWALVTARAGALHEGYADEEDALWTGDGRLVARAQQLVALI